MQPTLYISYTTFLILLSFVSLVRCQSSIGGSGSGCQPPVTSGRGPGDSVAKPLSAWPGAWVPGWTSAALRLEKAGPGEHPAVLPVFSHRQGEPTLRPSLDSGSPPSPEDTRSCCRPARTAAPATWSHPDPGASTMSRLVPLLHRWSAETLPF